MNPFYKLIISDNVCRITQSAQCGQAGSSVQKTGTRFKNAFCISDPVPCLFDFLLSDNCLI